MMTQQAVLGYVKAEPFRPFRIHMTGGRTFKIRCPETIKVLRSHALVFSTDGDATDIPEAFESIPLMLTESISHLDAPVT